MSLHRFFIFLFLPITSFIGLYYRSVSTSNRYVHPNDGNGFLSPDAEVILTFFELLFHFDEKYLIRQATYLYLYLFIFPPLHDKIKKIKWKEDT